MRNPIMAIRALDFIRFLLVHNQFQNVLRSPVVRTPPPQPPLDSEPKWLADIVVPEEYRWIPEVDLTLLSIQRHDMATTLLQEVAETLS